MNISINDVSVDLKKYIQDNVIEQYEKNNVGGHGKEHVETVISRSFELVNEFKLDVNCDIIYTIAAFHDIGYKKDPDNHEVISSEMFLQDDNMDKYFNDDEKKIISESIIDHRASLEYDARSIYGKIVSSADREVSVENMLKRSFLYQSDKHSSENLSIEQIIEHSYKKLFSKYGKDGYAKMYYPDKKYLNYLDEMQKLLGNKDLFIEREKEIAQKMYRK